MNQPLASDPKLERILDFLYRHPEEVISLDTETTGFNVKDGRDWCIGISIASGASDGYYFPVGHETGENISDELFEKLAYVIEQRELIYFQNAKFDLVSLSTQGIDYRGDFYDTIILAQLLDENKPMNRDLDSLSKHYLGKPGKITDDPWVEQEKKSGNHNITPEQEEAYAVMDAVTTFDLGTLLVEEIKVEGLEEVWANKQRLLRLLVKMEGRGVRINQQLAAEMVVKGEDELRRIGAELGYPAPEKVTKANPKRLPVLGPIAFQDIFIDRLELPVVKRSEKTGKPSFDKTVMEVYDTLLEQTEDPTAKLVKEFRGWQKAVSASYRPYLELVSPDGRLRCNYRLDRARTGRFSCEKPNLQQIPKNGEQPWNINTKACFIPAPGYALINADYSQLELRLATAYAGEESLKKVFAEGRDIFDEMSARMGFTRQNTKTFVYATQYGAGKKKHALTFGISEREAQRMVDSYARNYPHFKMFADMCDAKAKEAMKVKIWSGRYRHFQYASESYKAMNSVIQGGSADLMERVMLQLEEVIDDEDECRMLLQVHDAIVFEVREDLVDDYLPLIKAVMEDVDTAVGHSYFDVKFAVDAGPDYGSKVHHDA